MHSPAPAIMPPAMDTGMISGWTAPGMAGLAGTAIAAGMPMAQRTAPQTGGTTTSAGSVSITAAMVMRGVTGSLTAQVGMSGHGTTKVAVQLSGSGAHGQDYNRKTYVVVTAVHGLECVSSSHSSLHIVGAALVSHALVLHRSPDERAHHRNGSHSGQAAESSHHREQPSGWLASF